jgi:hypothetical protein
MTKFTLTAAALAAGLLVQTQGFAQVPSSTAPSASTATHAGTTSDPEKEARKTWHAVMRNIPLPGNGCFHARYPEVAWESVECKEAEPRAQHAPRRPSIGGPAAVGNGNDWVAGSTQGLIYEAAGKFFISGVNFETSETTSASSENGGAIVGTNDYSLQLNTNQAYTPTCQGNGSCTVWQQFIYATDTQKSFAVVYMQYWLFGWVGNCPSGWTTSISPSNGSVGCYLNSQETPAPVIPVTNLGDVSLEGWAYSGSQDCVWLNYEEGISAYCTDDSVLDIGTVWTQAEFNVVGDIDYSEADFNVGSSITVQLGIENGSGSPYPPTGPAAVVCLLPPFPGQGTTGETNNLNLGACHTGLGPVNNAGIIQPYIEFTESAPVPSTPCTTCGGGGVPPGPPPPIKQ